MMLQLDLERAGIPFETADGVIDLHSLRHGYISTLAKAGTPVKTLQVLARHADPRLTMNTYAHVSLFDTGSAVESLPDLSHNPQTTQANAATGTDGPFSHLQPSDPAGPARPNAEDSGMEGQRISEVLSHHFPTGGDVSGRDLSSSDVMTLSAALALTNEKPLISQGLGASSPFLSSSDARVADGI
jgi:hypothetical protein